MGTEMIGAKVELGAADVSLMPVGLVLSGLAVTDPAEPMTNAVEVARLSLDIEGGELLRRKVIITTMAVEGIREALGRGFRVTTNTTLFDGAAPIRVRQFFDEMMHLGVEGMMVSPGYSYSKAPDQEHFLHRRKTTELFTEILSNKKKGWRFNQSPLFLQFLMGKHDFDCTPWGNPLYNIFGWQRPCYLLQEGYAESFRELLETTPWENYGHASGNEKCQDCMVHCGFEPTAVAATFSSWRGFKDVVAATVSGRL